MNWTFDETHTAIVEDALGNTWRVEIKPDSFSTFIWVAKPVWHGASVTMYSGAVVWIDRDEAKVGAEATLTELGFTQPPEPVE